MATSFHLRPVSVRSASPTTSTSTTSERSPPPGPNSKTHTTLLPPQRSASASRPRRPLSPSTLRDVDLSIDRDMAPRKYPAPPTGHELMALFPPAPPTGVRSGPTSGYFEREERAFFAQKGKEIVRVRIEVDMPPGADADDRSKPRPTELMRSWPPAQPQTQPDQSSPHAPLPPAPAFPHPGPSAPRMPRPPVPMATHSPYHAAAPAPPPAPAYPVRSPHDSPMDAPMDDPDEAWRHPMPHNARRRAGKHTRRVIVK